MQQYICQSNQFCQRLYCSRWGLRSLILWENCNIPEQFKAQYHIWLDPILILISVPKCRACRSCKGHSIRFGRWQCLLSSTKWDGQQIHLIWKRSSLGHISPKLCTGLSLRIVDVPLCIKCSSQIISSPKVRNGLPLPLILKACLPFQSSQNFDCKVLSCPCIDGSTYTSLGRRRLLFSYA